MVAAPHDFRSSMNGGTVGCTVGLLNSLRIISSFSRVSDRSSTGSLVNILSNSSEAKMEVCSSESSFTNSSSKEALGSPDGEEAATSGSAAGLITICGSGASRSINSSKPFTGMSIVTFDWILYAPVEGSAGESGIAATLAYTTSGRGPCMSARSWRS